MPLQIVILTLIISILSSSVVQADTCSNIDRKELRVFIAGEDDWLFHWDSLGRQKQKIKYSPPNNTNILFVAGPNDERANSLPQNLAGSQKRFYMPFVISNNTQMLLACIFPKEEILSGCREFAFVDLKNMRVNSVYKTKYFVRSFVWSPDDKYFAVLFSENVTKKVWKSPLDWLAKFLGHPISYNTLYIAIYDSNGQPLCMEQLAEKVPEGRGYVEWGKSNTGNH